MPGGSTVNMQEEIVELALGESPQESQSKISTRVILCKPLEAIPKSPYIKFTRGSGAFQGFRWNVRYIQGVSGRSRDVSGVFHRASKEFLGCFRYFPERVMSVPWSFRGFESRFRGTPGMFQGVSRG